MKRGMPPGGVNPVPIKVAVKEGFVSPVKATARQPDAPSTAMAGLNSQGTCCALIFHKGRCNYALARQMQMKLCNFVEHVEVCLIYIADTASMHSFACTMS